jgi:hypothetical protein
MTKRSRPANIKLQKPMLRKSSPAPQPSLLVPARSGAIANRNSPELEIAATGSKINVLQTLIASQILLLPGLSLSSCRARITSHNSLITSFEIDSQNHLEMVLTLSKSIECNFETVRLMAARVPSRAPPIGDGGGDVPSAIDAAAETLLL